MKQTPFLIGLPSKGRLMEQTQSLFEKSGLKIERDGTERAYRGKLIAADKKAIVAEVAFLSASEIARELRQGSIDAGITGEDLLRESFPTAETSNDENAIAGAALALRLGFGAANVVVAVPEFWLDCARMADLDDIAAQFFAHHGKRLRVATKYINLTRRFFAKHGVTGYRIIGSVGATEGAPAAGSAELIVDITTSGATLKANSLKVLDDGLILASEAVLAVRQEKLNQLKDFTEKLHRAL